MLVHVEIPSESQQSLPCEVFCHPEIENREDHHQLVQNQTIEQSREYSPEEKKYNNNAFSNTVDDKPKDSSRLSRRTGILINLVPTLNLPCILLPSLSSKIGLLLLIRLLNILNFCTNLSNTFADNTQQFEIFAVKLPWPHNKVINSLN